MLKKLIRDDLRDFPGGPVLTTRTSTAGVTGLIPGWGTKIPHPKWWPKEKKIRDDLKINYPVWVKIYLVLLNCI